MAYVPGFEYDVFISYAQLDNVDVMGEEDGWITELHVSLATRIKQRLGAKDFYIFRDPKIAGNDDFTEKIKGAVRQSALFLSVLTPSYLNSSWCKDELNLFCQAATSSVPLMFGDKLRLFKVMNLTVPIDEHPEQLKPCIGYQFYEIDPITGNDMPLRRTNRQDPDQRYRAKLEQLAADVAALLKKITAELAAAYPIAVPASSDPSTPRAGATTASRRIKTNWNKELTKLEPYVSGRGGVVTVNGSQETACGVFLEVIKERIEARQAGNVCVVYDPDSELSYSRSDIISTLEKKLGVAGALVSRSDGSRIKRLIQAMSDALGSRRVAIVLWNWHREKRNLVRWFWRDLLGDDLRRLLNNGLLIICGYEEKEINKCHHLPVFQRISCRISLLTQFDGAELVSAQQDVAEYLLEAVPSPSREEKRNEIEGLVEALFIEWGNVPEKIHGGIHRQFLGLKERPWN